MAIQYLKKVIEKTTIQLLELASIELPNGVEKALRESLKKEDEPVAKTQLSSILKNIEVARNKHIPLCQDTGIPMFHLILGEEFPLKAELRSILCEAVRKATITIPLRPNAVHPLSRRNSGDNTGSYIPYIEWEIVSGSTLDIIAIPKGFGSENMSGLGILTPGQGLKGVKEFILDSVLKAGGMNCPPTIIGVGLGLGVDGVMKLARKAVLRPIQSRNKDSEIEKLENELLKIVNETGIGPMGLGGKTTSLAVNIEIGHTHVASLPVGVVFQCWAARRAEAIIHANGNVEYKSHEVK